MRLLVGQSVLLGLGYCQWTCTDSLLVVVGQSMLLKLLTGCIGDCCLCVLFYGGLCEMCVDRVLLYSIEMCFYLFSTGRGYIVPVHEGLDVVLRLLLRYCWFLLTDLFS